MNKNNNIIVGAKHTMKTIQIKNNHRKSFMWIIRSVILMVFIHTGAELMADYGDIYIDPTLSDRKHRRSLVMNANNMDMYFYNWGTFADKAP